MKAEYKGEKLEVLSKTCGLTRVQNSHGYDFWVPTDRLNFLLPENEQSSNEIFVGALKESQEIGARIHAMNPVRLPEEYRLGTNKNAPTES